MRKTKSTNSELNELITELRKAANRDSANIWKRIASDLSKPNRQRRVVNLSRINRYSSENDLIIVPGKVLGTGSLNHKLKIAAWTFSNSAIDSIKKSNGEIIYIKDLIKESPKGKKIKIMG